MFSQKFLFLTTALACLSPAAVQGFSFPEPSTVAKVTPHQQQQNHEVTSMPEQVAKHCAQGMLAACLFVPQLAVAVSGGGLDYANLDITGQDFSNEAKAYKGKDFTQVIAKGTKFMNSNLQGCRFYKAYLVNTDFSGADLRGAALDDTSMDGASLKGAIAAGAYFSESLLDVGTLENADFTDASIPSKTLPQVCERSDVKGTNPITGVDTAESLMCP